jgi:hypothetical protein
MEGEPVPERHTVILEPGGRSLLLAVELRGRADVLELKLYSKAMRCVLSEVQAASWQSGWNALHASTGQGLSAGLYYSVVTAKRGELSRRSEVGKAFCFP